MIELLKPYEIHRMSFMHDCYNHASNTNVYKLSFTAKYVLSLCQIITPVFHHIPHIYCGLTHIDYDQVRMVQGGLWAS